VVECGFCGSAVPAESRFCLECGRPLAEGAAPAARRDWRHTDLTAIGLGLLVVLGLVLVLVGVVVIGVVLIAVGVLGLLVSRALERREAGRALGIVRARALAARDAMAARSREQVEIFRARRELADLHAQRGRGYHDLGRAVFHGDENGKEAAEAALAAVFARIQEKEAEIETLRLQTEERVQRAHAQASPTVRMSEPYPPPEVVPPSEPAIPEPYPPPDEGTPPEPAPTPAPGEPTPGPEQPSPP
jgi:predicted nucleic acid-binding Zn ribbon protein